MITQWIIHFKDFINNFKIWPEEDMDTNSKTNTIIRLVSVLTVLGFLMTKTIKVVVTGVVTIFAIFILKYAQEKKKIENFNNSSSLSNAKYTQPTKENPFMNVMLHDIHENSDRRKAAPSYEPNVQNKINQLTKDTVNEKHDNLFSNLGDSFNFNQSMRQFHTTANTQIPNDQKAFVEFCFGK
tara:strand:+ start:7651 stop:8199 length:549 start_codon:yes stop_codon:yes gene_type:complete